METREDHNAPSIAVPTFRRVLVGVDASQESLEAARQAATLAEGPITLLSSYDLAAGLVGGTGPAVPAYLDEEPLKKSAEHAVEAAEAEIGDKPVTGRIASGRPWEALLHEIDRWDDTLVAVGSHGTGRALGIVVGSTATELIHKAPCSVLIARTGLGDFPSRIVVGLDGSEEALDAYRTAKAIAERFDAELEPVVAVADEVDLDLEAIERAVGENVRRISDLPVSALVSLSADADLVVVGSRGLKGVKALGSVSERVAHQAASSVLVVRRRP